MTTMNDENETVTIPTINTADGDGIGMNDHII